MSSCQCCHLVSNKGEEDGFQGDEISRAVCSYFLFKTKWRMITHIIHYLCSHFAQRHFNFGVCKRPEMRLLLRLFCFVQANKICISWMLFGAALINTRACFMRILRRDGLSICQRSLTKLLPWLIVALTGKENQVGLTLKTYPRFSICLLVTNSDCFSKHHLMHFFFHSGATRSLWWMWREQNIIFCA